MPGLQRHQRLRLMGIAGSAVCALGSLVPFAGPALAAGSGPGTVVVRGTAFPPGRDAGLSYVGCNSLFGRTGDTTTPRIGLDDGTPLGRRALGFDLQGGNAVGSLHYVSSFAATTSVAVSVSAPAGTTGVAYAAYQAPTQIGTSEMWIGRAPLTVPAGGWTQIDTIDLAYSWVDTDTSTGRPIIPFGATVAPAPVSASPHQLARAFGPDGAGVFTVGFGCDGNPFAIDALRLGDADGVTVYDLEGLTSSVRLIGPGKHDVKAGDPVTLQAVLRDGSGDRISHGTVLLSAKAKGGVWQTVTALDASDTDPSFTVEPEKDTVYRFEFVDRPLVEGSVSSEYAVDVLAPGDPTPTPTESGDPTTPPTDPEPSQTPTGTPSDTPSETASESPSGSPPPAKTPSATPPEQPSDEPSKEPTKSATAEPTEATSPEPARSPTSSEPPEPSKTPTADAPAAPAGSKPADQPSGPADSVEQ